MHGSQKHLAYLFTLVALQAPNSVHTLGLEVGGYIESGQLGQSTSPIPPPSYSLVDSYLDTSRAWVS